MNCSMQSLLPFLLIGTWTISAAIASAQETPMVAASGKEVLQRVPTQLVMRIDLVGRAGSLDEALKALEERKQSAGLLLKSLGAEEDSVEYGDPTTSNAASQGQDQMQAMIRRRIQQSGGTVPPGLKMPESTTVTLPLTAKWKLEGEDLTQLLKQATQLRKQIEEADISGVNSGEASLAEQELLEEAEAFGYDPYSNEQQVKPGTPAFSYAASITEEERREAMKAAFQAAQADAQELAAAAGQQLGELMSLTSTSRGGASPEEYYAYGGYRRGMPIPTSTDPLATESPQLGKLSFTFEIQARFKLTSEDN